MYSVTGTANADVWYHKLWESIQRAFSSQGKYFFSLSFFSLFSYCVSMRSRILAESIVGIMSREAQNKPSRCMTYTYDVNYLSIKLEKSRVATITRKTSTN